METKSQTSMTVQKKTKSVSRSKLLSKICCCTKIYEVDAVQISSGYFKRYASSNVSIRRSVRSVRQSVRSIQQVTKEKSDTLTGMAKFRNSQKLKHAEAVRENLRKKLAEEEEKQAEKKEVEKIMNKILEGRRPGSVTYKIDRSRSQPILRIKNYMVYDL